MVQTQTGTAILFVLSVVTPTHCLHAQQDTRLDPTLPYQAERLSPITYDVDFSVIVDERFREVLDKIVPHRKNTVADLEDVMSWVQANFEYDHHDASLRASAEHALEKRRGHCSDYHSFCASLGRVLGVPTRVTYGINAFPKNSPSHCKLEAFLLPYGWVSFDVSETQKLVADIQKSVAIDDANRIALIALAQARLTSGFRDNTWFLQTQGTDYDLVPAASKRVPVIRTTYIEADGVPLLKPDPADNSQRAFS